MTPYFYVLDAAFFRDDLCPALADALRSNSFVHLERIIPRLNIPPAEAALFEAAATGLPFDRRLFRAIAGQALAFASAAMPRIPVDPASVIALTGGGQATASWDRPCFSPIEQVFLGSRDLVLAGRPFRPFAVGWNDAADVSRLAHHLETVDRASWQRDRLRSVPGLTTEEDCDEEVALVGDWWPDLVALYVQAASDARIIVCEASD